MPNPDPISARPIDSSEPRWLLGVDAGGTKTRAVLAEWRPAQPFCTHGVGMAGPGNPLTSGVDAACEAIGDAIRQAFGHIKQPVAAAAISVAGTAKGDARAKISAWADAAGFAEQIIIAPDYDPILAASALQGPCAGVISGTGSVAIVRDASGVVHRAGGWGYHLGDEGSGYSIGRAAICEVLRAAEAQQPRTGLADQLLARLGVETAGDLPRRIAGAADRRTLVASLAPLVFEAAAVDKAANEIIQSEFSRLATTLARAIAAAGLVEPPIPMSLAGGIFAGCPAARQAFAAALCNCGVDVAEVHIVHDPAVSALMIASTLLP